MDRPTLDKVLELARPETVELHGVPYATDRLTRVVPPAPNVLHVNTLQAIVDYLSKVKDVDESELFVHVQDANSVDLLSRLNGADRWHLLAASVEPTVSFGQWLPVENFIISLQAGFIATADRDAVLRVVGNLRSGEMTTQADDGVTQTVTARVGIVQVEDVTVPNPVLLKPWRTFREIDQPESRFVLRLRQMPNGGAQAALFEADGDMWKTEAIELIKAWLGERVSVPVIG